MKAGDLIKLPEGHGYAVALKVLHHDGDPSMPTGNTSVMVIQEWGEDWWDADCCEVVNESR